MREIPHPCRRQPNVTWESHPGYYYSASGKRFLEWEYGRSGLGQYNRSPSQFWPGLAPWKAYHRLYPLALGTNASRGSKVIWISSSLSDPQGAPIDPTYISLRYRISFLSSLMHSTSSNWEKYLCPSSSEPLKKIIVMTVGVLSSSWDIHRIYCAAALPWGWTSAWFRAPMTLEISLDGWILNPDQTKFCCGYACNHLRTVETVDSLDMTLL